MPIVPKDPFHPSSGEINTEVIQSETGKYPGKHVGNIKTNECL